MWVQSPCENSFSTDLLQTYYVLPQLVKKTLNPEVLFIKVDVLTYRWVNGEMDGWVDIKL